MKSIFALIFLAALATSGNVQATTEKVYMTADPLWATSAACIKSPGGGWTTPDSAIEPCVVDIPLQLPGSYWIDQVSAIYGVNGPDTISIDAKLRYKDLIPIVNAATVDHDSTFSWSDHGSGKSASSLYVGRLMYEYGGTHFVDAFPIGSTKAYYLQVTLSPGSVNGSKPILHGLAVTYSHS